MPALNQPSPGRLLLALLLLALTGLLPLSAAASASQARLEVFASLPPQAAIVSRLGGPQVRCQTLLTAGQDPHTFEPKPRQVQELARAAIYFTSGLPFERALAEKIGGSGHLALVDSSAGIAKLLSDDRHGHGHEEALDPHVWLAPSGLALMAENIAAALCARDPGNQDAYRGNLAALKAELREVDARLRTLLAPHAGRTFYVFHPAFGYFAREYGLRQKAVETGGKSPSPRQLAALIEEARKEGVKIIFVQPQFETRNAQAIARAINGAVVAIDPMRPDVLANLLTMAGEIARALDEKTRKTPL